MKHTKSNIISYLALFISLLLIAACNKVFDEPPVNEDPNLNATISIMQLKARYIAIGDFQRITDDQILSGIVIADDRSGNFYKQIIVQDESGGIPVLLDANNVYTQYPVGRRVFIKLKGMMLGDYGGTIQLGLDSSRSDDGRFLNLDGIPQTLFDNFLVKGSFSNTVVPKLVKPTDFTKKINDSLLSTLVQIEKVEFKEADLGKTYADPTKNTSAVNFTITNCEKKTIVLRNSSYAKFAGSKVPEGNGILIGVPSIFNGTMQMFIRDTADVQFNGTRCSGQIPTPVYKTIAQVLAYAVGDSSIPSGTFIRGIVVSDTKNEAAGNYRLQDASGGIQIRFNKEANPNAELGDSLSVSLGGLALSVFNGGLQVNEVEKSSKLGTGSIAPRVATIADIKANNRAWESTVVKINNVSIVAGIVSSSGANFTISDASGSMITYIRNTAGIVMPTKATSITGYISVYQSLASGEPLEAQLTLRNQSDIEGGSTGVFAAVFDFANVTSTSGTTDPTTLPTANGVVFESFKAVGVGTNSSGSGRFSFSGWPTGATNGQDIFTGVADPAKYYEVTIAPDAGKTFELRKISFTIQRSSTGIRQAVIRSSVDNYAGNLPTSIDPANSNLSIVPTNIIQVTDAVTNAQEGCVIILGAGFSNISSAVTFRFYGLNAESTGGTFSIDNVKIEGTLK
ncbi:MAG TPA: DUF5689 domain-containing protein [Niabella sp.]|nr:DUF5689 domain-containing protein [Niabella sp.]HQW13343.1 DUF5689 domain-containing protein [Niabella sp.]HQX18617.1 DUF5689 domain-containing protein [Niabella sp.]HQX42267.1 DUF5689 domain-containing protein [Niabella sp.]HRB06514.1 DUF5689 domain-containing protein [Niabella sp.]